MRVLDNKRTYHPFDGTGERVRKRKTSSKELFLNASLLEICFCMQQHLNKMVIRHLSNSPNLLCLKLEEELLKF